jgi:molecular chaperone GrpE
MTTMFFKKKKDMSDQNTDKNGKTNEHTDNMAQNESIDEMLSNVLNTDDSRAGTDMLDEGEDEEKEKLKAEIAELKDKHIRQLAEFENFRRRQAKEAIELRQTAGKEIIQELLVALDDMDRAEKQIDNTDDVKLIKEGIALVFGKVRNILNQKGLRRMEAVNHDFDADLHEAITEIPAPSEQMKGKVIDEVESGYYLNDKLIRYAKVVVGK